MKGIINNHYSFGLFDYERHLSPFHSVTMHRISFADTAASRQSKQACSALDFGSVAPSFKVEICSPIIKNRLKTNF